MILMAILGALTALSPDYPTAQNTSPIVYGVDVTTGLQAQVHADLTVNCHEPITLYRTRHGDAWTHYRLHQDQIWVHVEKKNRNIKIRLEEADGTALEFVPEGHCNFVPGHTLSCNFRLITPVSNATKGTLCAHTAPQAYRLRFDGRAYTFTLTKGSNERKIYRLTAPVPLEADKKGRARHDADFALGLHEVRKPNGNRQVWTYDGHLKRIESISPDGNTLFGWVDFSSLGQCTTSDGQSLSYEYEDGWLSRVIRNGRTIEALRPFYQGDYTLQAGSKSNGATFFFAKDPSYRGKYDARHGLVKSRRCRRRLPTATFAYTLKGNNAQRHTVSPTNVDDGIGHIQRYFFDGPCIEAVESYDIGKDDLTCTRESAFEWDEAGRLLIAGSHEYRYDEAGNVIEDRLESRHRSYTYSKDGLNLMLSAETGPFCNRFSYKPGTDLLTCMESFDHDVLKETYLFAYDSNGSLIRCESFDPEHTYHQITLIHPRTEAPGLAMPEVIESRSPSGLLERQVLHYNNQNRVICTDIYDADNTYRYSLTTTYDIEGNITSQTDALGNLSRYYYDEHGNCTEASEPGRTIAQTFDLDHNMISQTIFDGVEALTREFAYDVQGNCIYTTDASGQKTTYRYDDRHLVKAVEEPLIGTTSFSYKRAGHLQYEVHPGGSYTAYLRNRHGELTQVRYPDGTRETYSYSPDGTSWIHTDCQGQKTAHRLDYRGRDATKVWAGDLLLCDQTTTYTYDDAGRLIQESMPEKTTTYHYDALGNINRATVNGIATEFDYDLSGNITCIRQGDAEQRFSFDAQGRCIASSDGTQVKYDVLGLPQCISDASGNTTTAHKEIQDGTIASIITDPLGRSQKTQYDARGRPATVTTYACDGSVLRTLACEFDASDNCTRRTIDGKTTTWRYSPMHLALEMTRGADTPDARTTQYRYNEKRQLAAITHPSGTTESFSYNEQGHLKQHSASGLQNIYSYDEHGRITKITSLDNATTKRTYNDTGHLVRETLGNDLTLRYELDSEGWRTKIVLPDDSAIAFTYQDRQLTSISRLDATGALQYTHRYAEYDAQARIHVLYPILSTLPTTLSYDDSGALSSLDSPWLVAQATWGPTGCLDSLRTQDPNSDHIEYYEYDQLDRLAHPPTNALYQLTSTPEATYSYDHDGNLTAITQGTETTYLSYNGISQLTTVETKAHRLTFCYDGLGRRLSKEVYTKKEETWELTTRLRFLWVDGVEIGALDDNDTITELRVLGIGTVVQRWATVAIELHGNLFQPIHDLHGNIVGLVDAQGCIAEYTPFEPFGQAKPSPNHNPWRYAAKRLDPETGLIYFGHRYYAPTLKRWLTLDPSGDIDGPDLYAYCHHNPLSYFDPDGRQSFSFGEVSPFPPRPPPEKDLSFLDDRPLPDPIWDLSPGGSETSTGPKGTTGRDMQDLLEDWGMWHPNDNPYANGTRAPPPSDPGTDVVIFTNGIANKPQDHQEAIDALEQALPDVPIIGVYNPTMRCPAADVLRASASLLLHRSSTGGNRLLDQIRALLEANPRTRLYLVGHSEGVINIRNALSHLENWQQDRICVIGVAPGAYVHRSLCLRVVHLRAQCQMVQKEIPLALQLKYSGTPARFRGDLVPRLDLLGWFLCRETIITLECHPDANDFDHPFLSPTYQEALLRTIRGLIKEFWELDQQ